MLFLMTFNEIWDTDGDGIGDNSDSDIDGDGTNNIDDEAPLIPNTQKILIMMGFQTV